MVDRVHSDYPTMARHTLLGQSIADVEAAASDRRPWAMLNAAIAWKWMHGESNAPFSFNEVCEFVGVSPDEILQRVTDGLPADLVALLETSTQKAANPSPLKIAVA